MSNFGLKSYSFDVTFTVAYASGTYNNFNFLAGNGLTIIGPSGKNVRIKKVSSFAKCLERTPTNSGSFAGQLNAYQIEFNFVDFGGQLIKTGDGFANLFVPNPGITVVGTPNFRDSMNHIYPEHEVDVLGSGIFMDRISGQVQNGVVGNLNVIFTITIWYDDLNCN